MLDPNIFKNPPKIFRGVPFWSINDLLRKEEIVKQVALLDEAGFGGAFFHAREGLVTPFLSNEWFEAFEVAVEEARSRDMSIWIYDEDRWPSGFAGGYVPALGDKYRAKTLIMIMDTKCFDGPDTVAMFRCRTDENGFPLECERIYRSEAVSKYLYLTFALYTAPIGDVWYSGFSYIDTLSKEAVAKFIEIAYRPYVERFEKFIGSAIPGVFTDEPHMYYFRLAPTSRRFMAPPRGGRYPIYAIPWTESFPEYFKKLNGYDIVDKLPELFFDIGNYTKTRYDFWRTATLLFIESFTKQIYEWCDKHSLKFTGHFLSEDTLLSQIVVGAVMPHYEYMHVPGVDHLGYQIWNSLLTVKQVASVANQLGKERVMCEVYGCLGNYPSFEDRKWIGDFLYSLGVNMLVHHLVPYSMRGRRRADYGLNFHWSQPWWKYNRLIEDYYTRLSYVLSQGIRLSEVLILSPITNIWSLYSPLNTSKAKKIEDQFFKLLKIFVKNHIDFELGDEMIISRYGRVEGRNFAIGRARYKVVILPKMINITRRVLELLKQFIDVEGMVVVVGGIPKYVDGVESSEAEKVLSKALVVESEEDVVKILKNLDLEIVVESDDTEGNILIHPRRDGDTLIIFISNVDRINSYNVKIKVKGSYRIELWNPFTGSVEEYTGKYENGETYLRTNLKPVESKLFILKPGKPLERILDIHKKVEERELRGTFIVKRRHPNILVLDFAQLSLNGISWSSFKHLYKIREELIAQGYGVNFKLKFKFLAEFKPSTPIYLVIENPAMYRSVKVNSIEIDRSKDCGYWVDWNFRKYDISNAISIGENIVEVEGIVNLEPEIEPIYILGDFAVVEAPYGESRIVPEKDSVELVEELDLTKHGYPFYSGEIDLYGKFELSNVENYDKIELLIEKLDAALALLYINGVKVGELIHLNKPSIDITSYIKNGENEIRIVLVGTLRNVFGPLHKEDPWWISPETFYTIDERWSDKYVLKPFGLKGIKLVFYKKI